MAAPAVWNVAQFGCLTRDSVQALSRMRTAITNEIPVPAVSRKGDTSASVELSFAIDVDNAGFAAWHQWWTYDLFDGVLPFSMFIPWGSGSQKIRARIVGQWQAARLDSLRWQISAVMHIDRDSLPRFSGGANA